jgi:DNA recombination protein RmuC
MTMTAFFIAGLILGCVLTFIATRRTEKAVRTEAAREGQVEITRLNERVSAVAGELTQCRAKLGDWEAKTATLLIEMDVIRGERAKFEERSTRVPVLELDLSGSQSKVASLLEEKTTLVAQLSERTNTLEYVTKQLIDAGTERQAGQEYLRSFRERFQEESNRVATLSEQALRLPALEEELSEKITENRELQTQVANRETRLAEALVTLDAERKQTVEKLALVLDAKEQLSNQFRSLANDILEEKTARFTATNKTNIDQILGPLKTKIQEFQGKVEEAYIKEGNDRSALSEQVRQLQTLNQQLSQDAHDLTSALKGSSKTQGNWGELILERVLEGSGLRKGHEYEVRETRTREDGSRAQPDVVLHMPENRHLVVDAKVSLTAYQEYTLAENDLTRQAAITRHISSVRTHIKELSAKNYQALYGLKSLDCVIMFVPVEPAFILAIAHDSKLWDDAWNKNVLLVSPSTLFFVVRTVAHLWRQEQQNRSVQDIARRGAELYDKLTGFVEDLTEIGKRLSQARDSYDGALAKLSTGRGSVIWQAEKLKEFGIKPSKSIAPELTELAFDSALALPGDSAGMSQPIHPLESDASNTE